MESETKQDFVLTVAPLPGDGATPVMKTPELHRPEHGHTHVPVHYRPRTRRSVALFAILVAGGLLAAFLIVHHLRANASAALQDNVNHMANAPLALDAVRVRCADPNELFTLPGDAVAFHETTIYARISGYVREWKVDIGDEVKAGDVLATIETPELDAQLRAANAKLKAAEAQVKVCEFDVGLATSVRDRYKNSPPGVVSLQDKEETQEKFDTSKSKLAAAQEQVNIAQEDVKGLIDMTNFKEVCAPYHGVITNRHATDVGQLVTAGSTSSTSPLYSIAQSDWIRVVVNVPQSVLPNIHDGMQAIAQAHELGSRTFRGTVDRGADSLDPHSRTMRVEVLVPNRLRLQPADYFFPPPPLRPGMYLQVTFQFDRNEPPPTIPPAALIMGPKGAQVAVVDSDGRIRFRPIVIDRDLGSSIEVLSGLEEGETVALNVGTQAVEGERVDARLIDAPPAPSGRTKPVEPRRRESDAGR